ncbi:Translation initiation factor IF-2, mitochondrial, variant 2 [Balamuthia mandrillaris]
MNDFKHRVRFDKPKDVIFSWPTTAEFAEHLGITPIYDDVDLIRDTSRFRRREGKAEGGEGELSAEELAEVLEREQRKGELVGESDGHRRAIQLKKAKKRAAKQDKQLLLEQSAAPVIKMEGRPGIVSVMGHVDHGKTTLLDSLRNTTVAQQEAGGITQQLTAFQVFLPLAKGPITFLDTPGHRAFFRMRSNGAYVSDLVLLIIAADEGIQSQTEESLQLAQESNIPVIIAINKIDLASSDLVIHQLRQKGWLKEKPTTPLAHMCTQQRGHSFRHAKAVLSQHHCSAEEGSNDNGEGHADQTTNDNEHSIYVPSFTGQPICLSEDSPIKGIVEISAKQKTNLEILEGVLHKQIQHLELKANMAAFPEATVVETFHEDAKRGRVLSIILHCGVLRKGQPFICGFDTGIVRGIWDATNLHKEIEEAQPAQPVEITGLHINPFSQGSDIQLLPSPGDDLFVVSQHRAKQVQEFRNLAAMYEETEGVYDKALLHSIEVDHMDEQANQPVARGHGQYYPKDDLEMLGYTEENNEGKEEKDGKEEEKENEEKEEKEEEQKELKLVLKADNLGSLQAIMDACQGLASDHLRVTFVRVGVGKVSNKDLEFAEMAKCPIYCFNVGIHPNLQKTAKGDFSSPQKTTKTLSALSNTIHRFNVFYHLLAEIEKEKAKLLISKQSQTKIKQDNDDYEDLLKQE